MHRQPLLVMAKNQLFLCILHCCMAKGHFFVAFLEAQVGNHPPKVAGEVKKIVYRNRCGVRLGAHNALDGEEAHSLLWVWEQVAPLLAYAEEDPTWQAVLGSPNIAAHFVLASSGCATLCVSTRCCYVS